MISVDAALLAAGRPKDCPGRSRNRISSAHGVQLRADFDFSLKSESPRRKNAHMSYPAVVVEERVTKGRAMNGLEEPWKRCGARLRAELGEAVFSSWFGRLDLESIANHQA